MQEACPAIPERSEHMKPGAGRNILFFVTCEKHIGNISMLLPHLSGNRVAVLTDVEPLCREGVGFLGSYDDIAVAAPDVIVMFMAYPFEKRLWFMEYSLINGVPCVGVEEVHQLSLNRGRVNHYFTPLDGLAVPSEDEKAMLSAANVPYKSNITVTGWGFFEGEGDAAARGDRSAVIFLSPPVELDMVSAETPDVRDGLLEIAAGLVGLGYRVDVRPHPMEPPDAIRVRLDKMGLGGVGVATVGDMRSLLCSYGLAVNRGNSQVCIEAMYMGRKILVAPFGIDTIFGDCGNVVTGRDDIARALAYMEGAEYAARMDELRKRHIPFTVSESLERVAAFIENSGGVMLDRDVKAAHLALLYMVNGFADRANSVLSIVNGDKAAAVSRFIGDPLSCGNLMAAVAAMDGDALAEGYIAMVYLAALSRRGYLRRLLKCDRRWLSLPEPGVVPHFWSDARKQLEKLYAA